MIYAYDTCLITDNSNILRKTHLCEQLSPDANPRSQEAFHSRDVHFTVLHVQRSEWQWRSILPKLVYRGCRKKNKNKKEGQSLKPSFSPSTHLEKLVFQLGRYFPLPPISPHILSLFRQTLNFLNCVTGLHTGGICWFKAANTNGLFSALSGRGC